MDSEMESPNPEDAAGPMLFLLRRMEMMELIVDRLKEDGVISPEVLEWARLKATLNHAERIIRVREKTLCPADDVKHAAQTIRDEIDSIELRLQNLV